MYFMQSSSVELAAGLVGERGAFFSSGFFTGGLGAAGGGVEGLGSCFLLGGGGVGFFS